MQGLQALIPFLVLAALMVAVALAQRRRQERAGGRVGEAPRKPPEDPMPERPRLDPRTERPGQPAPSGPVARPAARLGRPRIGAGEPAPAARPEAPATSPAVRIRHLLKDRRGRRLAILAHEILAPPGGRSQ